MRLALFIVRRLLLLIPTLLGVTLITFVLSRAVPVDQLVAIYINPHSPLPRDQQIAAAVRLLHLDEPIPVQYVYYLSSLLHGDWGFTNTNLFAGAVTDAVVLFFPPTVELAIAATFLATIIGIPLGTVSAIRKDRLSDHITRVVAFTGYSVPLFWLALLLQIAAVQYIPSLPIQGQVTPGILSGRSWIVGSGVFDSQPTHFLILDAALNGDWEVLRDALWHIVLPALTLTYGVLGGILRMVRSGMVDAMNQEYVKTAWSKGLPEGVIIRKHIRRNALLPVTTVIGLLFAGLLGGVVLVEDVFIWNGIGRWATVAIISHDLATILATTLIFALFLVLANLVVDILYAYLDPRITL
ncbi:MAG TPA: ABC transporter permease [Thermoplasmata archaeon]|nr:ABC transporter permease [Thermoplasmata archaeon]